MDQNEFDIPALDEPMLASISAFIVSICVPVTVEGCTVSDQVGSNDRKYWLQLKNSVVLWPLHTIFTLTAGTNPLFRCYL